MKEQVILFLMKNSNLWHTPTEIGIAIGKTYSLASSSVSPSLKQLLADGKIIKRKLDGRTEYKSATTKTR